MASPPAVEIKELSYRFPDGTQALSEVSLRVAQGETVAVIGPNGAGKSTLLLHLNGVLRQGDGAVRVCGYPVRRGQLREVRRRVGLVFQNADDQLFCPTVFEDVAFGPRNLGLGEQEVARRVEAALDGVEMAGSEERQPFHMSLGEKKRVALATVLALEPPILALDEPTANLDPRGRRRLCELLGSMTRTLIVATHDLGVARRLCGRAVVLDGGSVVADAPAEAILSDSALLRSHGLL